MGCWKREQWILHEARGGVDGDLKSGVVGIREDQDFNISSLMS